MNRTGGTGRIFEIPEARFNREGVHVYLVVKDSSAAIVFAGEDFLTLTIEACKNEPFGEGDLKMAIDLLFNKLQSLLSDDNALRDKIAGQLKSSAGHVAPDGQPDMMVIESTAFTQTMAELTLDSLGKHHGQREAR